MFDAILYCFLKSASAIGVDPGSGWPIGAGGATNNNTLVRNISIQQGNNDWASASAEWDVYPIDMVDSLGAHTMTSCAPPVPAFGPCGELFFSEYIEGGNDDDTSCSAHAQPIAEKVI